MKENKDLGAFVFSRIIILLMYLEILRMQEEIFSSSMAARRLKVQCGKGRGRS